LKTFTLQMKGGGSKSQTGLYEKYIGECRSVMTSCTCRQSGCLCKRTSHPNEWRKLAWLGYANNKRRYKGKRGTGPDNMYMYLRQTKYHTTSYNLSYMGGPGLNPSPIPGVSRVEVLPVRGFVLSGDLSVGHHLTETPGSCSRSL